MTKDKNQTGVEGDSDPAVNATAVLDEACKSYASCGDIIRSCNKYVCLQPKKRDGRNGPRPLKRVQHEDINEVVTPSGVSRGKSAPITVSDDDDSQPGKSYYSDPVPERSGQIHCCWLNLK